MATLPPEVNAAEIIASNNDLFALPDAVLNILEMAQKEEISVDLLATTIGKDPGLTGRLLKIANSPFYGRSVRAGNINDAVMALGITTVKCLAISASIFDPSKMKDRVAVNLKDIYGNILSVATTAQKLAKLCRYRSLEEAFMAGLLHKIGFLFYLQHFPLPCERIIEKVKKGANWLEEEKKTFGMNHTEAGAMIARKWRLPENIVTAIQNHYSFGFKGSDKLDDIIRLSVALNLDYSFGTDHQFEEKITKIGVIADRLEITREELDSTIATSLKDTLEFAKTVNIEIGEADDILMRANREIFQTYMSIQKLFKERQELTRNILNAEREKGVSEAKQIAISTLSHYINNASMIIYGQSQVLRMMVNSKKPDETIVDSLAKSLDTIDESIRRMVAVLDEMSELNMIDDVAFFDQSKILNIDDRIKERLSKLNGVAPQRSL